MLDQLPNRDTVAAFEDRLGKRLMSVLIWLMAIAMGFVATGIIVAGVRAVFAPVRTWLPGLTWPAWLERTLAVVLLVVVMFFMYRLTRRLSRIQIDYNSFRDNVGQFNLDMVGVGQHVEGRVEGTEKKLESIEKRMKYIEEKVGDEFTDFLAQRFLMGKGYTEEQAQKMIGGAPFKNPTDDLRTANARNVLREAAQEARDVIDAKSIDLANVQAVLDMQIQSMMGNIFGFRIFADFRNYVEITRKKREASHTPANGKKHLAQYAQYLEELADTIGPKDLDPDVEVPASWEQYKKAHS